MNERPPGLRWLAILGSAGFAAGFFGPMVFVPEANQGPLVGIFISGPAGATLGLLLYGVCSLLRVSARAQWRLLCATAAVGVVAIFVLVQPDPALRGYIYDAAVTRCAAPLDAEPAVLRAWRERLAAVTWASPRRGWEQDMRVALRDAPGILVTAVVTQQRSVFEKRKPWNRGVLYATPWTATSGGDEKSFYDTAASCSDFPAGFRLRTFQRYDLNGRIEPPSEWPPRSFESIIDASPLSTVPPELAGL